MNILSSVCTTTLSPMRSLGWDVTTARGRRASSHTLVSSCCPFTSYHVGCRHNASSGGELLASVLRTNLALVAPRHPPSGRASAGETSLSLSLLAPSCPKRRRVFPCLFIHHTPCSLATSHPPLSPTSIMFCQEIPIQDFTSLYFADARAQPMPPEEATERSQSCFELDKVPCRWSLWLIRNSKIGNTVLNSTSQFQSFCTAVI